MLSTRIEWIDCGLKLNGCDVNILAHMSNDIDMSKKSATIIPLPHKRLYGAISRSCVFIRSEDYVVSSERELSFEFSDEIAPPQDDDCDAYFLALVMDCMSEARDLYIDGSVSRELLSNLVEFQCAWNKWLPEKYSLVSVTAKEIREPEPAAKGAVCAFSGGVDSVFSVWRHTQKRNSYRSQPVNLCTMVHGFDIPLSDQEAFRTAVGRAILTLEDIGVKVIPIKTNYRLICTANWEDAHVAALVGTLSNFKSVAGVCIVGSTYPYNYLKTPWGSHPISDHLLGSDIFKVIHDGASHTRTEKVKEISDWQMGINNLRVCWQGDLKDRNCGKCEKCVRTKLNFLAVGQNIPDCFEDAHLPLDFSKIFLAHQGVRNDWQQIVDYATLNGIRGEWIASARKVLKRR